MQKRQWNQQPTKFNREDYHQRLLEKLADVFIKYHDNKSSSLSNNSRLSSRREKNINMREQILFRQYPMLKKGKNFNQLQSRTFRVDEEILYQIDSNGNQRELSYPLSVKQQHQLSKGNKDDWNLNQYKYRLLLEFDQRSPIQIYFEEQINCQQVHAFLVSKSKPHYKETFMHAEKTKYNKNIIQTFYKSLMEAKKTKSLVKVRKNKKDLKHQIGHILNRQLTNKNAIKSFIYQWATKAKSIHKIDNPKILWGEAQRVRKLAMSVDMIEYFNPSIQLKTQTNNILKTTNNKLKILGGEIKLWVGNMTHSHKIILNNNKLKQYSFIKLLHHAAQSENSSGSSKYNILGNDNLFVLESVNLSTCLQFQIQIIREILEPDSEEEVIKQNWRSQRWHIKDWIVRFIQQSRGPKIIPLYFSGRVIYLKLHIKEIDCPLFNSHLESRIINHKIIKPLDFSILHELLPKNYTLQYFHTHSQKCHFRISKQEDQIFLYQNMKSESENVFLLAHYSKLLEQYGYYYGTTILSFRNFYSLYQLLDLEALVNKFYVNYPFNQYFHVKAPGTFVYQYLLYLHRQSNRVHDINEQNKKLFYYDVEKLIWKHQNYNLRRFLTALKTFDQIPRINFTEPFYWICIKCLDLANKDSLYLSKLMRGNSEDKYDQLFDNSTIGRQSMAFFLVLAILKVASPLLLFQVQKKSLSYNSLLFHNILKEQYKDIYQKILETQINIEAFFGIEMTSLFSHLLPTEFFVIILDKFIKQRLQQQKQPNHPNKNQKIHSPALISAFITIIVLAHKIYYSKFSNSQSQKKSNSKNSCMYISAEHYMAMIRRFCQPMFISEYIGQFLKQYEYNYKLCSAYLSLQTQKSKKYYWLLDKISKFYNSAQYTVSQEEEGQNVHDQSTSLAELTLGQILQKLYNSFSCYKHKNEGDIRKLFMVIDSITLGSGEPLPLSQINKSTHSSDKRVIKTLFISIWQNNNRIYSHQLVNINGNNHLPDSHFQNNFVYSNLKHCIELKLLKLDILEIVVLQKNNQPQTKSSRRKQIYYTCKIDPKQLPSNYYIQSAMSLQSKPKSFEAEIQTIKKKQDKHLYKKMSQMQLYTNGSMLLQAYIKDSCEVQYIDNMVPEGYINNFLFKSQLNALNSSFQGHHNETLNEETLNKYKNDIMFCNHYFRTYRMPENNFNLLYSKLGWYGNHYLIPDDRISNIYKYKFIYDNSTKYSIPYNENKIQNTNQKDLNSHSELIFSKLNQKQSSRIYSILFYSRCIYGRGLIPKVNFNSQSSNNIQQDIYLMTKSVHKTNQSHNSSRVVNYNEKNKLGMGRNNEQRIINMWYDSASTTVGYLLNNFNGPTSNFVAYYWKMTKQLPLIKYLGFRSRQFYVLPNSKIKIQYRIPINKNKIKPQKPGSKQPPTYSQIHGSNKVSNFIKTKILSSKSSSSSQKSESNPTIIQQQQEYFMMKQFIIIFSNNYKPQFKSAPKANSQKHLQIVDYHDNKIQTNKFLTFSDISQSEAEELQYNFDGYMRKEVIEKSQQEQKKFTFIFMYCEQLVYLSQFLYLLKLNISKYYFTPWLTKARQDIEKQSPTKLQSKKSSTNSKKDIMNYEWQFNFKFKQKQIPNMQLYQLYQIMMETDYEVQLSLRQEYLNKNAFTNRHSSSIDNRKKIVPEKKTKIETRHKSFNVVKSKNQYADWAYMNQQWKSVQILVIVSSPHYCLCYVEQKYSKKKTLIQLSNIMFGIDRCWAQSKKPSEQSVFYQLQVIKFTDQQLRNLEDCVKQSLLQF